MKKHTIIKRIKGESASINTYSKNYSHNLSHLLSIWKRNFQRKDCGNCRKLKKELENKKDELMESETEKLNVKDEVKGLLEEAEKNGARLSVCKNVEEQYEENLKLVGQQGIIIKELQDQIKEEKYNYDGCMADLDHFEPYANWVEKESLKRRELIEKSVKVFDMTVFYLDQIKEKELADTLSAFSKKLVKELNG